MGEGKVECSNCGEEFYDALEFYNHVLACPKGDRLRSVVREVVQRCCARICHGCSNDMPVEFDGDDWYHGNAHGNQQGEYTDYCNASKIREVFSGEIRETVEQPRREGRDNV